MADIAKITTEDEWLKVVEAYRLLLSDPKTKDKSHQIKEIRNKLESFINKRLVKLNDKALKDNQKLIALLQFLQIIDKELPVEDFFPNSSLDIFPTIFKLTFYGEDHSVFNGNPSEGGYIDGMRILNIEEV